MLTAQVAATGFVMFVERSYNRLKNLPRVFVTMVTTTMTMMAIMTNWRFKMKMEVDSEELKNFILEVIRQNLLIDCGYSYNGHDQEVSLSILDDSESFTEATIRS